MKKTLLNILFLGLGVNCYAQQLIQTVDPQIQKMSSEVSAQNIETIVRKLVTFHTRHSLSDTTSTTTGSGAARNWIKLELERYAKSSNGRLKVQFDPFIQPADGKRITAPIAMKNVLAILPGTDPDDDRIFIVTGHYDSRASDVMDSKSYARAARWAAP